MFDPHFISQKKREGKEPDLEVEPVRHSFKISPWSFETNELETDS